MKRSVRIASLLLALILLLSGTALADGMYPEEDLILTEPSRSFTDTSTGAWYWDDLDTLVRAGGINGYEDGSFRPDAQLQMSEFVKILVSVMYPGWAELAYHDWEIEGQVTWYSPFVGVAQSAGLLEGVTVTKASMESPMTRNDMALVITNAAAAKGEELVDDSIVQYLIGDYPSIPEKYRAAVRKAYWAGILTGKDNAGNFYGSDGLTRAEACTVVVRLYREEDRVNEYYEVWTVQEDGGTYGVGVTMPMSWYDRFVSDSVVSGDKQIVSYYCKASYNDYGGGAGHLFSIVLSDSVCDYPSQTYVGRIGYKYAYLTYPTDVQYDPDNAESAREYTSMYNELHTTDAVNVVFTFR